MLTSLTTVCVSYFAAILTRYVRVSASVAFQEGSFQMNCLLSGMILFMAQKSLVDWQQLELFVPILKQSSSHFKRMRKLSSSKPYFSAWLRHLLWESQKCSSSQSFCLSLFSSCCIVQICSSEGKDPIVVVKREEGRKNKATRRTNQ